MSLPETPVLTVRPRWAVAVTHYARVYAEAASDADIRGHLRAGDVAEVVSVGTTPVRSGAARVYWYELSANGLSGWVPGTDLQLFESRSRAANAAALLADLSGATGSRGVVPAGGGP